MKRYGHGGLGAVLNRLSGRFRTPPPSDLVLNRLSGRPPSLALLCVLLALLVAARGEEHPVHERADSPAPAQAYASLLYSDNFLLGIRVLGQSLRETGTTRRAAVAAPPSPPHHCSLTSAVTSAILRNVRQPSRLPHKPSDV